MMTDEVCEPKAAVSGTFYQQVFRRSRIGMSVYDASGQCVEANEAIGRLVGADRDRALQQNFHHIESWKNSGLYDIAMRAVNEKSEQHHELRVKSSFGREIVIDFHFVPFFDDGQSFLLLIASDVTEQKTFEEAREGLVADLQKALSDVKTLRGIIPICSSCKKVRDDEGSWEQIESYINKHSDADFSHGICPDCMKLLYPGFTTPKR